MCGRCPTQHQCGGRRAQSPEPSALFRESRRGWGWGHRPCRRTRCAGLAWGGFVCPCVYYALVGCCCQPLLRLVADKHFQTVNKLLVILGAVFDVVQAAHASFIDHSAIWFVAANELLMKANILLHRDVDTCCCNTCC